MIYKQQKANLGQNLDKICRIKIANSKTIYALISNDFIKILHSFHDPNFARVSQSYSKLTCVFGQSPAQSVTGIILRNFITAQEEKKIDDSRVAHQRRTY